jgi:hypothetical protein
MDKARRILASVSEGIELFVYIWPSLFSDTYWIRGLVRHRFDL